ncbi:MAG: cbb3-type cytochrome c oxidase subunit 3 [Rhodothermales bacterium]|jgi:cbb3-type cytochrome oxidase subunit 3
MWKDVFRALETGMLAQIGLVAFIVTFIVILIRVFTISKKERDHAKNIPLDEPKEHYQDSNSVDSP